MLLQGLRNSSRRNSKQNLSRQFQKGKVKGKTKKVANLTLDQQVTCFAQIIINQLNELKVYENK